MNRRRRDFMKLAVAGAAGATVGCRGSAPSPSEQNASTPAPPAGAFQLVVQFTGLIVHGSHPAVSASDPNTLRGWDALLVNDGVHRARLRVPLVNVNNTSGFVEDRLYPGMGVLDLEGLDVRIDVDGTTQGPVTAVTGQRPPGDRCPTTPHSATDITWVPDFKAIWPSGGADRWTLKDGLRASGPHQDLGLVSARVRLSSGSIASAPPSRAALEQVVLKFRNLANYRGQFHTDLVRFTSAPSGRIVLQLARLDTSAPRSIGLQALQGQSTVHAFVEHVDPGLVEKVLNGHITKANYWDHHFVPYGKLFKVFDPRVVPYEECCSISCDPPFYCPTFRGYFV